MTSAERFLACMSYASVDRPPLWEWGPWPTTLRRWQREGLAAGQHPPQLSECDAKLQCGVDLWMLPRFEQRVLAESEESVTTVTDRGIVMRQLKDPESMSMPEHLAYPVTSAADWQALKKRFDPADPARFPAGWRDRCRGWHVQQPVLLFQGPRSPSLFGFVRELLGPERALLAFYDEPNLVHDMMEYAAAFFIDVFLRTTEHAPVTTLFFWEDMCYRGGSLISPALFREFMVPRYRRVTDVARSKGVEVIFVDSDGNVEELIPLWLESGINGVYPMEVAAGMDVGALRRRFGRDLLMTGGIDKRVLARTRDDIDVELESRVRVAEQGGYIPHLDHAIPHDVPYANFAYYWQRKKALLGIGGRKYGPLHG